MIGLSDSLAMEAERSSKVVYGCSTSVSILMNSIQSLGYFGFHRSVAAKRLFLESVDDVQESLDILDNMKKESPGDAQLIEKIKIDCNVIVELLRRIRHDLEVGLGPQVGFKEKTHLQDTGHVKVSAVVARVRRAFDALIKRHDRLAEMDSSRSHTLAALLTGAIVFGALGNIVGCFLAVRAFITNITERISVICENTDRLSRGNTLLAPVSGQDEIAEVDQLFHRMAALLKKATERDRVMLTGMPSGTITFSSDLLIDFTNPAFERMTGFSEPEIVGRKFSELIAGNAPDSSSVIEVEHVNRMLDETALGKVTETRLRARNASVRTAQMCITRYETEEKPVYVCSLLDVSERRELEDFKRDFVKLISDDLATPLTAIRGVFRHAAGADYGALSSEGAGALARSERECSRLIDLTSDLLALASIESGRLSLQLAAVPLATVVEQSLHAVQSIAQDQGINIETSGPELMVSADANRLIQVLVNLLSNALKYSPRGAVVSVDWRNLDERFVELAVSDQGCGIAKESLGVIFTRFGQARRRDEKTGSGLGLAICKLIIEEHGGGITVESKPGAGSKFIIVVPAAPASPRACLETEEA